MKWKRLKFPNMRRAMNRSERTVKMQRFLVHAKAPLTQQTLGRSTDALGVSRIFLLSAVSIIGLILLALSAKLERRIYGQHGAIWWLLPLVALYLIVWLLPYVQWRWRRPPSSGFFNIWSNA